jgi:hypothetical protein
MRNSRPFASLVGGLALLFAIILRSPVPVQASAVSVFADGFETGNLTAWTTSKGLVAQQALAFTGSWAGRAITSGSAGYASNTLAVPRTDVTLSARVDVVSTASTLTLLRLRTASGSGIASVKVNKTGKLVLRNEVGAVNVATTTILDFGTWYVVTLHVVVAGTTSTVEVSLDGTTALSRTMSLGTSAIGRLLIGTTGSVTGDVAFDDVVATVDVPTRTDPIVTAAGDICPVKPANCKGTANLVVGLAPDFALTLGDAQYTDGTLAQYLASYDTTWGIFQESTRPAPGNHDWYTANAQGYRDYFGSTFSTTGGLWYSYDVGGWHVISLDSNCTMNGGCGSSSAEYMWLQQDLANDQHACTLAYWHHPLFSSGGHGGTTTVAPLWTLLEAEGAEVVLNGHNHLYERFAPQTSSGVADVNGIREFVVGTGGASADTIGTRAPNSEVAFTGTKGVIELTLAPASYAWRFVSVSGTVMDQGTDACH